MWERDGVKLRSILYRLPTTLFDHRSLVTILSLLLLDDDDSGCSKVRVVDDGFFDLTNAFRGVHQLLYDTQHLQLQTSWETVVNSFMLARDVFELHFSHHFFNIKQTANYCIQKNIWSVSRGATRQRSKFVGHSAEKTVSAAAHSIASRSGSRSVGELADCWAWC